MGIRSRIQRSQETAAPAQTVESAPAQEAPAAPAPAQEAPAAPAPAQEAPAAPAQTVESAPAQNRGLTARKTAGTLATVSDQVSLVKYESQIDPTDFGYGDIPRIVANNNMIFGPDKMRLGTFIDVQLLSYSPRWMVSPGSDDEEAREEVRASYDGETISHSGEDNGMPIQECLERMKARFPKAAIKEYIDVFCLMVNADERMSGELLKQEGILNISLSPRSKGKFLAYVKQIKLTVMRGLIAPEKSTIIRFKTQVKTGDRDFTILVPAAPPREVSDAAEVIEL